MNRLALILAACALAAVVTGVASARSDTHSLLIRLISDNKVVGAVDNDPKGLSAGDRVITTSTLRNQVPQLGKPKGALVGRDRVTNTFLSKTSYKLVGYAVLPGGKILFRGTVSKSDASVKVTGGTGRFAHASGTVVAESETGTRAINVYRLTLPS